MQTERIGPYEIRGELGRGAMAVVWRAWDPKLEREVAIKEPELAPGLSDQVKAEYLERFQRECKTVARLNHANVITVYDAGVFDGRSVVVMELVTGETLGERLKRGPLSPGEAVDVMLQLLEGLQHAHSMGIVHRDVKPDNIFVTSDGRVKLADFGIAAVAEGAALTKAGIQLGSPGYMAPEQIRGESVDQRADIFAAGVFFYEMVSGVNPFRAEHPIAVMDNVIHRPIPQLLVQPELRSDVDSVIARATAKDPGHRYQSALEMSVAVMGAPTVMKGQPGATSGGPHAGLIVGVGAAVLVGATAVLFLAANGSSPPTAVTPQVALSGANGAVGASAGTERDAGDGLDGGTSALDVAAAQQEERDQFEASLKTSLFQLFNASQYTSGQFDVIEVKLVQDSAGRWWGAGTQFLPEWGNETSWAVMVHDGYGWQRHAQVYHGYGIEWEGASQGAIPQEVRTTLLSDIPEPDFYY